MASLLLDYGAALGWRGSVEGIGMEDHMKAEHEMKAGDEIYKSFWVGFVMWRLRYRMGGEVKGLGLLLKQDSIGCATLHACG